RYGFPQVFETSASTNSATRALLFGKAGGKTIHLFWIDKKNSLKPLKFFALTSFFITFAPPIKRL
ncbi:MAG: hypothetical protein ACXVEB_09545, partial [Bacteroidia bacterium]